MIESDEEFARRLQAEENGEVIGNRRQPRDPRPLINGRENETVINARLNDINSSRSVLCVLFSVNMPQVLATMIVLGMHWNDENVCDEVHTLRWKWWAIFAALRMTCYSLLILFMHMYKPILDQNPQLLMKTVNARNAIDAFNLVWFIVGNMWLFGDDGDSCSRSDQSPIYNLCKAMLIISYIQICLPCILAIMLVPVFCFCMPCLIRLLARLNPTRTAGAPESVLASLPEMTITAEDLREGHMGGGPGVDTEDPTTPAGPIICPICLNEMAVGDQARLLRCNHVFHKQCVDEWLRINASCPTCRKRIVDDPPDDTSRTGAVAGGGAAGSGDSDDSTGGTYRSLSMSEEGRSGAVDRAQEMPLLLRTNNSRSQHNPRSTAVGSRILSLT
jgi:hypothetical protein